MTIYQKIKHYLFHQNMIVLTISFGWAILSFLAHLESVIRAPNGRVLIAIVLLGAMTFVFNIPLMLLILRILERIVELIGKWRGYAILFIAFVLEGVIYSTSKVPSTPVVGLFTGALAMAVLMAIALVFVKGSKPFVSEDLFSEKPSEFRSFASILSGIKPAMKWWVGAGGVAIAALVAIGFAYLQPSGFKGSVFKGSVEKLYESARTKQINYDNYEAWVAQDVGVEVLITNLACNSDGDGSLFLGRFTTDGREVKACWKLDEKGVGIVSLTGQAKRIRPDAFKVQTVNGQLVTTVPVVVAPKVVEKPPAELPVAAAKVVAPQGSSSANAPATASALVDISETSLYKKAQVACPAEYTGFAVNKLFMSVVGSDFAAAGQDWYTAKKSPRWMMHPYMAHLSDRPLGNSPRDIEDFKNENAKTWKDCVSVSGKIYAINIGVQRHSYGRQSIALTSLPSDAFIFSENYDGDYSIFTGDEKTIETLLARLGYER